MQQRDRYIHYAAECVARAAHMREAGDRLCLMQMAVAWRGLADLCQVTPEMLTRELPLPAPEAGAICRAARNFDQ